MNSIIKQKRIIPKSDTISNKYLADFKFKYDNIISDLFRFSRDKHEQKSQIIINADYMTSHEKICALDNNYEKYAIEVLSLIGLALVVTIISIKNNST